MLNMVQDVSVVGMCGMPNVVVKPTTERYRHSEIREVANTFRVVNAVQSMYDAGDIGDDELAAADRWYREYVFASLGVMENPPSDGRIRERGDIHTWMMGRGQCSARLTQIRDMLGLCAHVRLEMLLAREMSFSAMARHLYPALSEGRARMKVSAQCALLLEQLAHVYETMSRNKNRKKSR
ncbi:hypothetical protein GRO01_24730 [Gluconobacter roseus NBRC 3990]|uniref:Uncharacterized protein n=2 Tax=Gluconobacter roseus TaxID=586239 RepID=A0A4Y3M8R8_9PROT|nr:hypothetical protein [Gluconobacter roseus]KXV44951.1 hypothetical protein AD943_01310 [Gluconobacter roseus]GBR46360.1 hypothetical protein AA3990_1412 [Gluconobacter roseus NBRC 3990]GEB04897.1 hypothetical protein GRO01_24730 [Gluconobacter roseus NBRC 3990]GLP94557.1 hypothetical protein GCM10007871_25350 [Gluconobacter roseus NBRC 3990]